MSALPRPDLPPGPHRDLVDALHDLHHRAGWPSLRMLGKAAGCSHTTVSTVFSSPRLPAWGLLELLVEAMAGDTADFRRLWLTASARDGDSPPVAHTIAGRRTELAAVRRHLESGSGLLLVTGEAGIGKTRLVTTAVGTTEPVVVLSGACMPLSKEAPLLPLAHALRAAWLVDNGAWVTTAMAACPPYVSSSLRPLLPELPADTDTQERGDDWDRHRLFFAVGSLLDSMAAQRPLALSIDDLHWADSTTLDLLEHILGAPMVAPAVVATYRLEDPSTPRTVTDWLLRVRRTDRVTTLELGPLSHEETAQQIELLVGSSPSADLVDRVHVRAQGHPLFTEQLVSGGGDVDMPALIGDLLDRRIEGLSGNAWAAARALAVVDRPVEEATLGELAALDGPQLVATLHELDDKRLLLRAAGATHVSLRHPLLAEAIRRKLTTTETTEQHRVAAATLAREGGSSPAEIAEHWRRVGDHARELDWTVRAARLADERFAGTEAAGLWQRALALWPPRSFVGDPPISHAGAYAAAIDACRRAGRAHIARALAHEALAGAEGFTPLETAELLRRSALDAVPGPEHSADRLRQLEQSIEIYRTYPPCEGLVHSLDLKANFLNAQGEYAAAADLLGEASTVLAGLGNGPLFRGLEASIAWQMAATGHIASALRRIAATSSVRTIVPEPERDAYVAMMHSDILLMAGRPAPEVVAVAARVSELGRTWLLGSNEVAVTTYNAVIALCRAGLVARAGAVIDPVADREASPEEWQLRLALATVDILRGRAAAAADELASLVHLPWTKGNNDLVVAVALADLWRDRRVGVTERLLAHVEASPVILTPGTAGAVLTTVARSASDETRQVNDARRQALHARLAELPGQHGDPFGTGALPVDAAARHQWEAELARLQGTATAERWTRAASDWDKCGRPHDAAYCRWRAAQVALALGRGTVAARLLKRARGDARQHVPLSAAIAATSRGG